MTIRGQGTEFNQERTDEAHDILFKRGLTLRTEPMTTKEALFIEKMSDNFDKYGQSTHVSIGQLGWLRDLYAKYGN